LRPRPRLEPQIGQRLATHEVECRSQLVQRLAWRCSRGGVGELLEALDVELALLDMKDVAALDRRDAPLSQRLAKRGHVDLHDFVRGVGPPAVPDLLDLPFGRHRSSARE
jgi:hypothetical protein